MLNKLFWKLKRVLQLILCFLKVKYVVFSSVGEIKIGNGTLIAPSTDLEVDENGQFHIGEDSRIHRFGKIATLGGEIAIGSETTIGDHATFLGNGQIKIGDRVMFADNTKIVAFQHQYENAHEPISKQPTTPAKVYIGDDSWIGINVTIVGDVEIGCHCVIAAGSVVTKSIPDFSVAAGIPAKVIKKYCSELDNWR
ncbi:acyltransferase [Vibrio cyclitrophicus]|uniref:acyltransferase n=1 Tax=Vibrio cyclitrophicus TaxID=47951 RepID=UPI000C85DB24|nr:acyltransferase [Vibrio cyclitrophicus]PMJ21410.1 hypothetical protein BCU28_10480 [Vibrio cyclitrophicus]